MYLYKNNWFLIVSMDNRELHPGGKKILSPSPGKLLFYPDKLLVPIRVFESITP
jgi:hypothetical protein